MRQKIIARIIGWAILFIIIVASMLCGCETDKKYPFLNGEFANDGILLIFDNGKLTGETKCNILRGGYFTNENKINISIGGTKIFCINEYNITYFQDIQEYKIKGNKLILKGNDFEIILHKVK